MLDSFLFSKHLEEEEKVKMLVHKHWVMGFFPIFWPTVAFVAAWVVLYEAPHRMILYLALFGSTAALVWWLRNFLDYYMDAWIITDKGVIDLEWRGWFSRKATRILYSDVQGVSYEIQGIVGTFLHFGTLTIEKVSTGATVSLPYVRLPRRVEACVLHNMEEYMHKKNLKNSKHVEEILATFVADQVQMQGLKTAKKPEEKKKAAFSSRSI